MKLSVLNIKNFFIFSQKNLYIYIYIYIYVSGKGNPRNLLYSMRQNFLIFQEVAFWGRKTEKPTLENVLIYQELELSSPKFKTHFIFQEKVAKPEKIKFIILLKKIIIIIYFRIVYIIFISSIKQNYWDIKTFIWKLSFLLRFFFSFLDYM